jgi:hypothetical protein
VAPRTDQQETASGLSRAEGIHGWPSGGPGSRRVRPEAGQDLRRLARRTWALALRAAAISHGSGLAWTCTGFALAFWNTSRTTRSACLGTGTRRRTYRPIRSTYWVRRSTEDEVSVGSWGGGAVAVALGILRRASVAFTPSGTAVSADFPAGAYCARSQAVPASDWAGAEAAPSEPASFELAHAASGRVSSITTVTTARMRMIWTLRPMCPGRQPHPGRRTRR